MAHQTLRFRITGDAPLIPHNVQLADPLNEWTRRIKIVASKRKKTDADFEELARLEWYGSLYLNSGKPCIPGEVLEAAIVNAAKKSKQGMQAKMGIYSQGNFKLVYPDDELSLDDLWKNGNYRYSTMVVVQGRRVLRTRPIFREWSAECELVIDDELFNESGVWEMLDVAGRYVGLMDWRPRYGRFGVEK